MAPQLIPTSPSSLEDLAWAIDRDGIDAHLDAVHAVAARARRCGVRLVLAGLLVDDTTAAPVRERAFGLVAMSLAVLDRHAANHLARTA